MKEVILVLVITLVAVTSCDHYYIVPVDSTCQNNSCFTLQQLSESRQLIVGLDNLTLTLSPGQHILESTLFIENLTHLLIKGLRRAVISFTERSSSIQILSATVVEIHNVQFVKQFAHWSKTFQCGLKVFNADNVHISNCYITGFNCSYRFNGYYSPGAFDIRQTQHTQFHTVFFYNNDGKSLHIQSNKTYIQNCRFIHLRGRAIAVESDSVNISNTRLINNVFTPEAHLINSARPYDINATKIDLSNWQVNCSNAVLYSQTGNMKIYKSIFVRNNGKAICTETGNVFVYDSQFYDNAMGGPFSFLREAWNGNSIADYMISYNARRGRGGAIYTYNGKVIISRSVLANNNGRFGGALYSYSGNIIISDSTLTNNNAEKGGAVYTYTGKVSISNSNLTNNVAQAFVYNDANYAGAIYTYNGNVNISGCNLINNTVRDGGGAIYTNNGAVIISDSNLINNSANNGGAIYSTNGALNISGSNLRNNRPQLYLGRYTTGGAVFTGHGNVNIFDSILRNNTAQNGGAIYSLSGNTNITNCYLMKNNAVFGGAIFTSSDKTTIFESYLTNNTGFYGGAISFSESILTKNSAGTGGEMFTSSNAIIADSTLTYNNAQFGGAIYTSRAGTIISNSNVKHNNATHGGAIFSKTKYDTMTISHSILATNSADEDGGVIDNSGALTIIETIITNNNAHSDGGAIHFRSGYVNILGVNLTNNTARNGGAIAGLKNAGELNLTNCNLLHNSAHSDGGAIDVTSSKVYLSKTTLANNEANRGGAIHFGSGVVYILRVNLTNNTARNGGAIAASANAGEFNLTNCNLLHNSAHSDGGAIDVTSSKIYLSKTTLANNEANRGGAIHFGSGVVYILGVNLTNNTARNGGAIAGSKNAGELNMTNCNLLHNSAHSDGGAIDVTSSEVYLTKTTLANNEAYRGGAIYLKSSATIQLIHSSNIDGAVHIINNTAMTGGGIFLYESGLSAIGRATISYNKAHDGGGIYAITLSYIELKEGGDVIIASNRADRNGAGIYTVTSNIEITSASLKMEENRAMAYGGGMYLQHNAQLNFAKCPSTARNCSTARLKMSHNTADYGGGIYVDDDTADSDLCEAIIPESVIKDCFIRNKHDRHANQSSNYINVSFYNNTAKESGNDLFGGLLDRCKTHQSSEVSGITYIKKILSKESSISSRPVQVKFCDHTEARCKYVKYIRRGQSFMINLEATDQTETPIAATIHSSVSSGHLRIGQQRRSIKNVCSQLEYNIFSNASYVLLDIYADGPCTNMGLSKVTINVTFQPCECPLGFQKSDLPTECRCDCDPELDKYIKSCNLENGTIELVENVWIGVHEERENVSNQSPYIIHKCPFDYCVDKPLNISLNTSQEGDRQCANNRSGDLCGECSDGLSLTLATSICKECSNIHLLLIIPFALAGILLVGFLLVFNITVASGTIQGLIFFANILAASKEIFLPFTTPNFLTVFVSWVNLDVGIQTCFYNGLNSQAKVLLQLVFPAYIFFLIILIIVFSKYSRKFSNLLTNRNPVAVLCTLVLLSYSKLLRMTITALQNTVLHYPDGVDEVVWLYDGNINYFTPSHIPPFISAAIILLAGGLFTVFLFFGQCFSLCSKWKIMKWVNYTKYHAFVDAYHAPFTPMHRYWTGLLLFALMIQNLIAAMAPKTAILSAGCIAHGLIFLKIVFNPVYKKWFTGCLETCFLLIIIFLSYGTLCIDDANEKQRVLATVSMAVAFVLLVVIIYYHVRKFVLKLPKAWLNIAILAYGVSNVGQESHTSKLATVSMVFALTIITGTVIYHIYTNKKRKHGCINIRRELDIFNLNDFELRNVNKDIQNEKADNDMISNVPQYNGDYRTMTDPHRYITPPIIRPATKLDQLREPYLDVLAPITEDDYKQAPPPTPANIPPKATFCVVEI